MPRCLRHNDKAGCGLAPNMGQGTVGHAKASSSLSHDSGRRLVAGTLPRPGLCKNKPGSSIFGNLK